MTTSSTLLQFATADWIKTNLPDFADDILARVAKFAEEMGEFARAVIGQVENRPDRGDPIKEAAQCVLVLLSIFGEFYPFADLYAEVEAEMRRVGITP